MVTDAATYTQQSFNTIRTTLIEAVMLTGLILLLFLHTWRSTLIVLISIPTSVLTTFALMNVLGMNLNLFSMLALTLSVGILVDDSIVVLENIYRHLGLGEPPSWPPSAAAARSAWRRITITMVDVVVYVPIALISGIAGRLHPPFALVIAAATLTSLAGVVHADAAAGQPLSDASKHAQRSGGRPARPVRPLVGRGFDWLGATWLLSDAAARCVLVAALRLDGRSHAAAAGCVIALGVWPASGGGWRLLTEPARSASTSSPAATRARSTSR